MTNVPDDKPKPVHAYLTPSADEPGRPVVMGRPVPKRKKEGWRSVASTIAVLLIAPFIALLLTMFVFQSYQVDGPSMQPTLQNNDRLIVWKLPRTWAKITGHQYQPDRGDIVVFAEPDLELCGVTPGKQLIKRVLGLPGERVVIKDGTITVYNDEHPKGFQPDATMDYGQTIPATNHDTDLTVPAGRVFMVGDNRLESLDSRCFGPVSLDNIIGKLSFRVLPLNKMQGY